MSAAAARVDGESQLKGLPLLALYVLATAAMLSPVLWARVPPLVDYPNHLARAWILTHAASIPELAANYVAAWRVLPDLAMDSIVVALAQALPVEIAGRVFVALTMASLVGGTAALHKALHGRVGLWPLMSLFSIYNGILFLGFLSCLFSMGMALAAFAGWIAARRCRLPARIAVFAAVALGLMLGHLFAFGLYGLLVAGYELGELLAAPRRTAGALARAALPGLQFVPAIALWLATKPPSVSTFTGYVSVWHKLSDVLVPYMFDYAPHMLDVLTWLFCAGTLGFGLTRGRLAVAPSMRTPLILAAVATVAMPIWLNGGWGANLRLPVMLPPLIVAATEPRPAGARRMRAWPVLAALLLAARVMVASLSFAAYDGLFAQFRSALPALPLGARLMVVAPPLDSPTPQLPGVPAVFGGINLAVFRHLAALAVIDRSAFFPYEFARWNPIHPAARNLDIWQGEGQPASPEEVRRTADPSHPDAAAQDVTAVGEHYYWRNWPATFDYAFWISFDPAHEDVPAQMQPVARGSYFTLYRIAR